MNNSLVQPALVIQHVSTVFTDQNGGLQALEDISFSVAPQEFVCVLGPSGCGKTTLLRALAGLLHPTSGEISYQGRRVDGPQAGVGVVFQRANLMPWRNVLDNILLPLEVQRLPLPAAREKASQMAQLVGLHGFESSLPRQLSGGMAQRVALARALVQNPDLLLLDEPFGSLDALTRERMGTELLDIWQRQRKTVVMVTHSISEALLLADRVLVLTPRPGRLCLDLPVDLLRPRSQETRYLPEFSALARQVRAAIA
jgi:NitT/TauT family transport system ATP-binding protein